MPNVPHERPGFLLRLPRPPRGGAQLGVQVKRTKLPVRLPKAEFDRILAESGRFGWRAIVAAVTPDDGVHMIDPAKARVGKELRLDQTIPNVLAWMDGFREGPVRSPG